MTTNWESYEMIPFCVNSQLHDQLTVALESINEVNYFYVNLYEWGLKFR